MANLYDTLDSSVLKKPGQYKLDNIILTSYQSAKSDSEPDKLDVTNLLAELNVYESIFNKTLSGNITLVDTQNVVGKFPLTGNERIEFKLFTPSSPFGFDFTEKSGNPMYIYKIQNRQSLNPRTQLYTINFCSKEMITNELIRISNTQTSEYSNMVANITKDTNFLSSAKRFYYEPSYGLHKHIFCRLRPFDAIDQLSKVSRSLKFHNSGYYFYETSRGFNYRSIESMLAVESNTARPVAARFRPKPANIADNKGEKDIKNEMQIAMEYQIKEQFDTLKNLRNGVYASQLITHDQLEKTYTVSNFNYEEEYSKYIHTETDKSGGKENEKSILPKYNKEGKSFPEFSETALYLESSTTKRHNNIENPNATQILQSRLSQRLAFQSLKLQITVNGFTGLQAGDLITFEMPSHQPNTGTEPDSDIFMSGRYLVTAIRHQLNKQLRKHIMVLECMKDSVRKPYPSELNDTFINREKNNDGIIDIYEFDDLVISGQSGFLK